MTDWLPFVEESIGLMKEGKHDAAQTVLESLISINNSRMLTSPRKEKSLKRQLSKKKLNLRSSRSNSTCADFSISIARPQREYIPPPNSARMAKDIEDQANDGGLRSPKQEKGWGYVVRELLHTERSYVGDLHTVIDVYREPLLAKGLITTLEANSIFSNISTILTVNGALLEQLESLELIVAEHPAPAVPPQKKRMIRNSGMTESTENVFKGTSCIAKVTVISPVNEGEIETQEKFEVSIDGLATFLTLREEIEKHFGNKKLKGYRIYHNKVAVGKVDQLILAFVGYNKLRLDFTYKVDKMSSAQSVGDAILKMAHYLKVYSEYCSNQMSALHLLNELKKKKEFSAFLKTTLRNSRVRRLGIDSFLLLPLQRVCKYPLLLRELLSQTPKGHPDFRPLTEASQLIGVVVSAVNEKKGEMEGQEQMLDLQQSLEGHKKGDDIITPARKFDSKGNVNILSKKTEEEVEYFLFSDLLAIVSVKDEAGKRKLLCRVDLAQAFVTDKGVDYKFTVSSSTGKKKDKASLICKNQKEKTKLMVAIHRQIVKFTYLLWAANATNSATFEDWYEEFGKKLL